MRGKSNTSRFTCIETVLPCQCNPQLLLVFCSLAVGAAWQGEEYTATVGTAPEAVQRRHRRPSLRRGCNRLSASSPCVQEHSVQHRSKRIDDDAETAAWRRSLWLQVVKAASEDGSEPQAQGLKLEVLLLLPLLLGCILGICFDYFCCGDLGAFVDKMDQTFNKPWVASTNPWRKAPADLDPTDSQDPTGVHLRAEHSIPSIAIAAPTEDEMEAFTTPRSEESLTAIPHSHTVQAIESDAKWVNFVLAWMWPRMDAFIAKKIEDQLAEVLYKALPKLGGLINIQRLSLGSDPPELGGVRVRKKELSMPSGGTETFVVLDCMARVDSDTNVSISVAGICIYITHLKLEGAMTIVFRHLQDNPPWFSGMELYFINTPDLDLTLGGAVTQIPGIQTIITNALLKLMQKQVVLPNRFAADLNKLDDTGMDDLKFPDALGVLRIHLLSAHDILAGDVNFFSKPSSDPYVIAKVGMDTWTSPVINNTLHPRWREDNQVDFFVHDPAQQIEFQIWDSDISSDDFLGGAPHVAIEPLTQESGLKHASVPLSFEGKPAGILNITAQWLTMIGAVPDEQKMKIVGRGPAQIALTVKLLGLRGLPEDARPPFKVCIAVGEKYKKHTRKSHPLKLKMLGGELLQMVRQMDRVFKKSAEKFRNDENRYQAIAWSIGLHPSQIKAAVTAKDEEEDAKVISWEANKAREVTHATFDENICLLLPWNDSMKDESVTLKLHDKGASQIGDTLSLPIADVVENLGTQVGGPFKFTKDITLKGSLRAMFLHPS